MSNHPTNILVIGASGILGSALVSLLQSRDLPPLQTEWLNCKSDQLRLDITDNSAVEKLLEGSRPRIVFNCSGFTDVDGAEEHEAQALAVNGRGVENLARACHKLQCLLVHISTDYVFDGRAHSPYQPNDPPDPQSAYGRSKLAGEKALQSVGGRWLMVRTAWLFGKGGKNFVDTILALARQKDVLKVVNDQFGCPTYAPDLARCLADLAEQNAQGIYHFCNGPVCTWFDLACKIVELARLKCHITPCPTSEFPRPAKRPAYSVLDCSTTLLKLSWPVRSWQKTLEDYLQNR